MLPSDSTDRLVSNQLTTRQTNQAPIRRAQPPPVREPSEKSGLKPPNSDFGAVAVASFSSGSLLNAGGWGTVNALVFPPVLVALGLLARRARARLVVPAASHVP